MILQCFSTLHEPVVPDDRGTIRVFNPSNGDGLFHIGANPNNTIITGGTIGNKSAEFEYEQPDFTARCGT
jgi:hypothetical protein